MALNTASLTSLILVVLASVLESKGAEYYGKKIGDLSTLHHQVRGAVYAVDSQRIYIRGFSYDGTAPDAYFWVGERSKGVPSEPNSQGTKIPDEYGREEKLKAYADMNIILTLPGDMTLTDIRWLSVWCKDRTVDFGNLKIDANFEAPAPKALGDFVHLAHATYSSTITIINHRTIEIKALRYDGRGPDAFFWVGTGTSVSHDGHKVPDENGSLDKLKGYDGTKTVTVRLPEDQTVLDIDWFSIYCILATQVFAYINIPDPEALNVPPFIDEEPMAILENCQKFNDYFEVAWQIEEDFIIFDFIGSLLDREYMSFGLSGSDSASSMGGADVIVAYYDFLGPAAIDHKLTKYSQCSSGQGACPDTEMSGGQNDVELIKAMKEDGIVTIRMRRALSTGDTMHDSIIHINREMYIVWAIGTLNDDNMVTKHTMVLQGNAKLNFGREPMRECPALELRDRGEFTAWTPQELDGEEITTFKATIGPTGGAKGYEAITGKVGWGIAWYINGILIPELYLRRGYNYTFVTNGGDDTAKPAKYHPFYITSDPAGGRSGKTMQEQMAETVYAGENADGTLSNGTVGKYCEWNPVGVDKWEESETFEDYKKTLTYTCDAETPGGILKWSPDDDTPDIVYYQCYTHRYLGWKIHILDSDGTKPGGTGTGASITSCLSVLLMTLVMFLAV